jgi:hypothetical protein
LEIDLNNSKDKMKRAMLQWAAPAVALGPAGESGLANMGPSARSAEAGETFPPPAQQRQPSILVVASDDEAEAGG